MTNKVEIKKLPFGYRLIVDGKDISSNVTSLNLSINGGEGLPSLTLTIPCTGLDVDLLCEVNVVAEPPN